MYLQEQLAKDGITYWPTKRSNFTIRIYQFTKKLLYTGSNSLQRGRAQMTKQIKMEDNPKGCSTISQLVTTQLKDMKKFDQDLRVAHRYMKR